MCPRPAAGKYIKREGSSGDRGLQMAVHRIEAEPEVYGAAAFLLVVHMARNLAGRDKKAKAAWSQLIEHAAKDAETLDTDFGRQVAALIRHVLVMKPLFD